MDLSLLGWGDAGWGDEFLRGMGMTIAVAICAFLLSIVFGTLFAAAKLSRFRALKIVGDIYTTVLRGVPELLVIYLVFFGGGSLLRSIGKLLFGFEGYIDLPIFITGVFCIGVSAGAYATEVIRGAVLAIQKGDIDAAHAIGMTTVVRLRRILIPQAARFALPGLGNVWQFSLKETALISIVSLVEIMRTAALGTASTKEPFTFYITAFFLFLFLCSISSRGFHKAEIWAERGVRRE
jgi:octopine/nopaline transport system permease protein